jgi:hypothetical protein
MIGSGSSSAQNAATASVRKRRQIKSMNFEINEEEQGLLLQLLESRIGELHAEIRRCMDHDFKDGLRHDFAVFEKLQSQLKSLEAE